MVWHGESWRYRACSRVLVARHFRRMATGGGRCRGSARARSRGARRARRQRGRASGEGPMRERLVTACGALLALLVLYAAFFQSTSAPVTRPVTPETGRNGYAAVSRWLESAGYRVISFRERYAIGRAS